MSASTTSTTTRALRPRGQIDYSNNGAGTPARKPSIATASIASRPSPPASVASSVETAVRAPINIEVKEETLEIPYSYNGTSRSIQRIFRAVAIVGLMVAFLWITAYRDQPIKKETKVLRTVSRPALVDPTLANAINELKAANAAIYAQNEKERAERFQEQEDLRLEIENLQEEIQDLQAHGAQAQPSQAVAVTDLAQAVADLNAAYGEIRAQYQEASALRQQESANLQHELHLLQQDIEVIRKSPRPEQSAEYVQNSAEIRAAYEEIKAHREQEQARRQQDFEFFQEELRALKARRPLPPLANFASSFGARIIGALTSRTFAIPGSGFWPFTVPGKPPITALEPDLEPGHCWPMAGTNGQLAISLLKPIIPSSVTISHPAAATWTGVEGLSAMQDFEVWAVYDEKRFKHLDLDNVKHLNLDKAHQHSDKQLPAGIKLLSGTFDPYKPVERYFVDNEAVSAAVPTVVLRIKNNHGNRDWTCVYNVQVHGTPANKF
ncbi:hypothetical protein HDU88_002160 [Geranomyces variabilis]|nr:hypothetical protein HDU88_002160 [Geranomyces variabilis]